MTTQFTPPSRPAPGAPGPACHRRIRTGAAITGVAALIITGTYIATTTIGPTPPRTAASATDVNPSAPGAARAEPEHAGQHRSRHAADATVNLTAQVRRELRESNAGQCGPVRGGAHGTRSPEAAPARPPAPT